MIELAAEPVADRRAPRLVSTAAEAAGAMPPPEIIAALQGRRIGRGPAWIAAIGLVVICFAAVANYWGSQNDAPVPSVAASVTDVAAPAETADAAPRTRPGRDRRPRGPGHRECGVHQFRTAAATMMPAEATATAEIPGRADNSTDAAAKILPAAQDTTDVELANVEEPVTPDAAETAAAGAEDPAALDDLAPPGRVGFG